MSKFKGANWKKRLLSVGLASVMVVSMLATSDLESIVNAAGLSKSETLLYAGGGVPMRTRTVLNDLPIPDTITPGADGKYSGAAYESWLSTWRSTDRGTIDRPFVVLELVPYYEQATFGYMIEGCEPFAFEKMAGNEFLMNKIGGLGGSYCTFEEIDEVTYFFPDEIEGQREFYQKESGGAAADKVSESDWNSATYTKTSYTDPDDSDKHAVLGYYEVVPEGQGYFRIMTDESNGWKHIVKANNANPDEKGTLNWHTVNQYVKDQWDAVGYSLTEYLTFEQINNGGGGANINDFINLLKLDTVGSRYLTRRPVTTLDPVKEIPSGWLKFYRSNDIFVRDSIGLTKAQAQTYSVAYKAITPVELNQHPEWADICDLVYVSRENKDGAFVTSIYPIASNYERLARGYNTNALSASNSSFSGTYTTADYSGYAGLSRDISADVALRLFNRVAAAKNYIGIIFDSTWHNGMSSDDRNQSNPHYLYDLSDNRLKDNNGNYMNQNGPGDSFRVNIGKLYTMCMGVKPSLTKRFFVDKNKIGVKDGYLYIKEGYNREAGEAMYWNALTFYIGGTEFASQTNTWGTSISINNIDSTDAEGKPTYESGKMSGYWEAYNGYLNYMDDPIFVQGHVYNYNGNTAIFRGFENTEVGANTVKYSDFDDYVKTNAKTKNIWEDLKAKGIYTGDYSSKTANNIAPWAAIRYILDLDSDRSDVDYEELRVLDVEPSVALGTDRRPSWKLTADDVALMVPSVPAEATITIDHYIMGAFVGKNGDLNELYDLIYIGEDAGGFWSGQDVQDFKSGNSNWNNKTAAAGLSRTDFYDDNMDGLVYFHVGDVYGLGNPTGWGINYMYDVAGGRYEYDASNPHTIDINSTARQPGNDITSFKKSALEDYIKADYPVVAARNLYDTSDHPYVDKKAECILWQFLSGSRASRNADGSYTSGVYFNTEVSPIDERVRNRKARKIEITGMPVIYDSNDRANTYVPKSGSYGVLNFSMRVPNTTDYAYKIYLDQDRNGKFDGSTDPTKNEVVQSGTVDSLNLSKSVYVTDGWVGFVQWRIEVYKKDNPYIRTSAEGCSAIQATTENKNKILALQIMPNNNNVDLGTHTGTGVKRTNNRNWTDLYDLCTDFEIEVYTVTFGQFEKFFRSGTNGDGAGYGFSYNMGADINISEDIPVANTNPNRDVLALIEGDDADNPEHANLRNTLLGGHHLGEFNMLIIGFADSYGSTDFSNQYGCTEYLFYFAEKGCSILFTHDLSHYKNDPSSRVGYSANAIMRDIMGMNRYGTVSTNLINDIEARSGFNVDTTCTLAKNLAQYNINKGITESTAYAEKQGYTFWNLMAKIANNANGNKRAMYKYQIVNPAYPTDVSKTQFLNRGGNSNGNNAETNKAYRLNQGQITQYPFNIPEVLTINNTHSQYYQLSMEDEELTVWYTLEDAYGYGGNSGDALRVYGVTPHEAANNYYIYSKGNIFYSGVGHSGISGRPERELFVNTLIAAYRPMFEKPEVIITNTDAVISGRRQYVLRVDQEFDYDESNNLTQTMLNSDDYIAVTFIPRDYSGSPTLKVTIFYEGGIKYFGTNSSTDPETSKIYKVVESGGVKTQGAEVTAHPSGDGMENTYELQTETEYMIYYPKKNLKMNAAYNHIVFDVQNDKVIGEPAITDLYVKPRPLFLLD